MIGADRIVPMLLTACPRFQSVWDEHLRYWADDSERGHFNDMAEFVHFLIEEYGRGHTDSLAAAFAVVENVLADGDEEAKGIAAVGIIETLQNAASWKLHGAEAFRGFLGPNCRRAWAEVEAAREGKKTLMDVIRAERGEKGD